MLKQSPPAAEVLIRLFLSPLEHAVYPSLKQVQSAPIVSPDGRHVAIVAHEM